MPCIEYKGKKYTYEEFGAMLRDGAFAKMAKSGELNVENLGAEVPSSLLEAARKQIGPQTSSNFANLTTDEDGNYVFFHRGAKGFDEIRPGTGQSGITPSNEAAAIGRVGGVAMYYTKPTDSETMVSGQAQYAVTIAPDEVYDFNEDPENYIVEARQRFEQENPGEAFDANNQLAYITKIAGENGYKMVVAEWTNGRTRAQTTEALKPTDTQLFEGDVVTKKFDKQYTTNEQKGWSPVVPETRQNKLDALYNKIYKERNKQNRYDDLYRLEEEATKKTQDEITELINNSDISQELKDEYNQILGEKEQTRRSERKAAQETTALDDIFDNTEIQSEVDNALKAMSEIMPELKIVVHDTYDSYLEALGESEEAESGGFFDNENTIHINKRAASDTTVAHEVFHAVLKKMLGSERAIQKKALSMVRNLSGQIKSDPRLKATLDEFVGRYTENPETMNEEAISELFGMLNAGYAELKPVERSAIRKFIDAIAKLLGLGDFLRIKENEYVDLLNTLSQRIRTGEAITAEDVNVITRGLTASDEINSMGVSGVINTNNVTKKKSILATGEFERYPVNPNAKVEENVPLSRFDGKRSNVFESDRMTGAFIADDQGNKLFNFFGGIFYPIITGKWWASNTMTKASGIAKNSKRDADGYIYGTPIIMKPGSQMSNNDMLLATLELMKMDALKKNSGVTKAELMLYVEKAFDKKKIADKKNIIKNALKKSNNIEQIFDELEYTLFQEEGFIKDRNGNDILNDNGQRIKSLTFEERKEFVSGVLGDRKVVSDKFPSAGSMSAMAERFTEPETQKSKNVHDIVIVYRTKGNLVPKKSDKKDPFYHKSYPYEISAENQDGSPAEIEVFILDGAYNLSEAIKELTKSSGETFSYEEYYKKIEQGKYKSEKVALAQYGRTAKLSYASGNISARKKQIIKQRTDQASDKLKKLFERDNIPLTIQEAKEIVGEVIDWADWYDNLSSYVGSIFQEYSEDILSMLPLSSMAANSSATVGLSINNAEKIYKGEKPSGVAEYYGYVTDFLEGKGIKSDKMSEFFKALTGNKDAIAVDMHVWSLIMGKDPNKKQVNPSNKAEFEKAKEFVRVLSDELGLAPREVQAALWAANILRTGGRPDSYEEYFKKQLDEKGLSQRIENWRNQGYKPFSEVRKEKERAEASKVKKQTPAISKKIEAALNSGATEQEIIDKMTQVGYTEAEAKAYIEQYNNMRSDEYSRVKANIDTITKKVADRAGKNANPKEVRQRQYDDAMNYLQSSLWYENASDTEREASVRELRSDLGFKERTAPVASKVTEGKRDTITIDSLQALNQSIRDQDRGAKAALKDLAEKREALRVALNTLVNKAKITARQATTILNKFSKVNLNDDQAVKDLIDYVEQTYKDAEITNQVRQAAQTAKDERRGAKTALKDLAEKREALRVALNTLVNKAKITARQATTILNKFSKVNLNDDQAVKDLIDYVEQTYKDAEITNQVRQAAQTAKDERRGAKTALKDLAEKREALRVALNTLVNKAKITARQATTILNKFSKVNLNDDQAVKDLIDYVEQTYKDAEITNQVRQAAQTAKDERRGAKTALKDLAEKREALRVALKSLVTSGKITNRQASVMLNKAMSVNLNNDNAVDKLIKYIEKVYNNAEIAEKMSKANAMRRVAKKNIRSKIGSAKVAFPILDKLFSIDSREIPLEVLDTYVGIVNQFGKRVGVLSTDKMADIIQKAQDVISAINEEVSKVNDLAMIFEMYPDKVLDANGDVLFDKTVKKMKDDGYIDDATAKEMDEYRSDIYKKERATKEEDAQERKDLIKEIVAAKLVTSSRLSDANERKAAREIIQMARNKKILKALSTQSLRNLAAIMKNIDAGFFPNYGVKLMQAMQIEQQLPDVKNTFENVSLRVISNAYNKLKSLVFRGQTSIELTLESNLATELDFMLGDNKNRHIYNAVIKPLAKAYATFDSEVTSVREKMSEAVEMLERQFSGNTNKVAASKFKIMAYMLQKEFESNPGQKGVAPAIDFINQTIKAIKGRDTIYTERDVEILEDIKENYMTDGQIDMNKIMDSLSAREKKALGILESINTSMHDKAIFTSGVIRGNRTNMYNNYVPHSVISRRMDNDEKMASVVNVYNNVQAVGTKAGSLQERTSGAKPIMFDPFLASMNSATDVLLDFHMTIPMQTTNKLLQRVKNELVEPKVVILDSGQSVKIIEAEDKSIDAVNAVQAIRDRVARFVFTNNKYHDDSILATVGRSYLNTMYRNTLGSVPRFINELQSNSWYVLTNPANWASGVKYVYKDSDAIGGVQGREIMSLLGSTVVGKLYGKGATGKFADVGLLGSDDVAQGSSSKGSLEVTKDVIARYSVKPLAKFTDYVGDTLVSTPDKLMSIPIWYGSFANEFKRRTGEDIEFSKITDERYRNKYKAALDAATDYADNEVVQAASTVNPFQKAAKLNVDKSKPAYRRFIATVNNYLTNFMITEFNTARAAAYSLVTEGRIPKPKAAAMLTGVYLRVVTYTLMSNIITGWFYSLLGFDKDDEEEEELTWDDVVRAAAGGFISMLVSRNFGNIFKIAENYGIEKLNEEYGDMLRQGEEYDPYKHSLVFNKIKEKDFAKDPLKALSVNLAGPYGESVKGAWKINDLIEYDARYVGRKGQEKFSQKKKDFSIGGFRKAKRMEELRDDVIFRVGAGSGLIPFAKDIKPIMSGRYKKKGED